MFLPSQTYYTPGYGFEPIYILLWQNWLLFSFFGYQVGTFEKVLCFVNMQAYMSELHVAGRGKERRKARKKQRKKA